MMMRIGTRSNQSNLFSSLDGVSALRPRSHLHAFFSGFDVFLGWSESSPLGAGELLAQVQRLPFLVLVKLPQLSLLKDCGITLTMKPNWL